MKNLLSNNLKALREAKGYTQTEAAALLGLKRPTYVNYEKGGNEPGNETLLLISRHYGVSIDALLSEKLTPESWVSIKHAPFQEPKAGLEENLIAEREGFYERKKQTEESIKAPFGSTGNLNVYDLEGPAVAAKAVALLENDKGKAVPTLALPELGPGLHIRITAEGDSMEPVVGNGSKPVGTWIPEGIEHLTEGALHLVADTKDGMVVKRLYRGPNSTLCLASDNPLYRPYFRHSSEIQAVFRVRLVCTTNLSPQDAGLRRDIIQLQAEIEALRNLISVK